MTWTQAVAMRVAVALPRRVKAAVLARFIMDVLKDGYTLADGTERVTRVILGYDDGCTEEYAKGGTYYESGPQVLHGGSEWP